MVKEPYLNYYADIWVALAAIKLQSGKGHPDRLNDLLENDGFTKKREEEILAYAKSPRQARDLFFQFDIKTITAALQQIGQEYKYDMLLEIDPEGADAAGVNPHKKKPVELAKIEPGKNEVKNAIAAAWLRRAVGMEHLLMAIEVEKYLSYHDDVQHAMVIDGLNGDIVVNLNDISSVGFPAVDKQAAIGRITAHVKNLGEFYNSSICQFGRSVAEAHGKAYEIAAVSAAAGRL